MKQSVAILSTLAAFVAAEVPQEQSHKFLLTAVQDLLQINNVFEIQDPVFGLLGDAAAVVGAGLVTNLDCLHQITADEAFTNALTLEGAARVNGLANALLFAAVERNTGSVGLKSVLCNEVAVNAEIAAITQHQDPASEGAAQLNKDIALALAVQLASVGADPTLALLAGTFAPGDLDDNTGAGNTCDDEDDPVGCIFTQNLIVPDASIEEINAAVAAAGAGAAGAGAAAAAGADAALVADIADLAVRTAADSGIVAAGVAARQNANVQAFAGALGGAAPAVAEVGGDRPFEVNGATFQNLAAALERSCSVQSNACSNAANAGQLEGGTAQCGEQEAQCKAQAAQAAKAKRRVNKVRQTGALDFGSCSDPSIIFAEGLDGRKEASFAPANGGDFSQGSAQNINIISNFICSALSSSCKADEGTVQACETAKAAADGLQGQAAANAFNSALGV